MEFFLAFCMVLCVQLFRALADDFTMKIKYSVPLKNVISIIISWSQILKILFHNASLCFSMANLVLEKEGK